LYAEPCAIPASPPMTTKSTPCRTRVSKIGPGSNSGADTVRDTSDLTHSTRVRNPTSYSVLWRECESCLVECRVESPLHRRRVQVEPFVHHPEELRERRDARRDDVALDTRDRGLRGPCANRELTLRQAVPAPRITEQLACGHAATISDQISRATLRAMRRDDRGFSVSPVAPRRRA